MTQIQKHTINHQPVWTGYLTKRYNQTSVLSQKFVIRPLTVENATAMGQLSADIYRALRQEESCYIHKHEPSYYRQIFNNKDIHYIGVFVESRLIGMSYLNLCRTHRQFLAEIPGSPIDFFKNNTNGCVATFGADCVHPEFRGNGLNQLMIAYRLAFAKHLNCCQAASIIDRHNHWNMTPYFNNGFKMYASAIDPSDNGQIALMSHDLQSVQTRNSFGIRIPYRRFELIDRLLALGFVGRMYDRQKEEILFSPERKIVSRTSHIHPALFTSHHERGRGMQYV